jgi:hypothetical protein
MYRVITEEFGFQQYLSFLLFVEFKQELLRL